MKKDITIHSQWQEMADKVDTIVDGQNLAIDKDIRRLVIICNLLGLHTTSSCQGHDNWATGGPYIDFGSPDEQDFYRQYEAAQKDIGIIDKDGKSIQDQALQEKYYASTDFNRIRKAEELSNAIVFDKVLKNIHAFYAERERRPYTHIQLSGYRLECEGVAAILVRTPEQKQAFLKQQQEEFKQLQIFFEDLWLKKIT